MHRMVGRLAAGVQHLYVAIDVSRRRLNRRQQRLRREMVRTRAGNQQPAGGEHA